MTPIETSWSSSPWWRTEDPSPGLPHRDRAELAQRIEGRPDDSRVMLTAGTLRALLAAAGPGAGAWGAEIHDHDRDVSYRATVDPRTSDLNHLEVVIRGFVSDNALARVPVARIRRVVLAQVAADQRARAEDGSEGSFTVTLPGGYSRGDGSRFAPPSTDEVAELMRQGLDRNAIAARYGGRPVRTVDRWMTRARAEYPDLPSRTRGRTRTTPPQTAAEQTKREKRETR